MGMVLYRSDWFKITKFHRAVFEGQRPGLAQSLTFSGGQSNPAKLLDILEKCQPSGSTG